MLTAHGAMSRAKSDGAGYYWDVVGDARRMVAEAVVVLDRDGWKRAYGRQLMARPWPDKDGCVDQGDGRDEIEP